MLTTTELLNLENKVSHILKSQAPIMIARWQEKKMVFFKNDLDPFTEIDIQIEETIRFELGKLLPQAGFIVEEGKTTKVDGYNWVIDPIDQTKNFIGKIPLFYTQLALIYNDLSILGVIYNPISGQLFSASFGNGTKLNNELVAKPQDKLLEKSIIDIDFGGKNGKLDWKADIVKNLFEACYRIRMTGGSFNPYLLTFGIDGIVALEQPKIVDQMPRIILAQEAGFVFKTFDFKGRKISFIGSQTLFEEIRDKIFGS